MVRCAGIFKHLIAQSIPHLRFISPVGQQVDIFYAASSLFPFKTIPFVEINIVTFFGKISSSLTMKVNLNIIVKFT